ncbi:MAG: 6-phosphogluconolactonase, partial [Rhizobiales bacterium]|nr:6-phosphogluconolactonase [Hyphomicrobiales bacterium]
TIPGGSTPFPILADLIDRNAASIDWAGIAVWPNDDRIVPEDHEASNIGKIRALLEPSGARVVALGEDAVPPHFALTWLGMGPDGHIASLFPNTDPQGDDPQLIRRLTPDPLPAHAPFDRITLTIPALLNTDAILFTLGGAADKRAVFEAASRGEHDLPVARLLRAAQARGIPVTVFA